MFFEGENKVFYELPLTTISKMFSFKIFAMRLVATVPGRAHSQKEGMGMYRPQINASQLSQEDEKRLRKAFN